MLRDVISEHPAALSNTPDAIAVLLGSLLKTKLSVSSEIEWNIITFFCEISGRTEAIFRASVSGKMWRLSTHGTWSLTQNEFCAWSDLYTGTEDVAHLIINDGGPGVRGTFTNNPGPSNPSGKNITNRGDGTNIETAFTGRPIVSATGKRHVQKNAGRRSGAPVQTVCTKNRKEKPHHQSREGTAMQKEYMVENLGGGKLRIKAPCLNKQRRGLLLNPDLAIPTEHERKPPIPPINTMRTTMNKNTSETTSPNASLEIRGRKFSLVKSYGGGRFRFKIRPPSPDHTGQEMARGTEDDASPREQNMDRVSPTSNSIPEHCAPTRSTKRGASGDGVNQKHPKRMKLDQAQPQSKKRKITEDSGYPCEPKRRRVAMESQPNAAPPPGSAPASAPDTLSHYDERRRKFLTRIREFKCAGTVLGLRRPNFAKTLRGNPCSRKHTIKRHTKSQHVSDLGNIFARVRKYNSQKEPPCENTNSNTSNLLKSGESIGRYAFSEWDELFGKDRLPPPPDIEWLEMYLYDI